MQIMENCTLLLWDSECLRNRPHPLKHEKYLLQAVNKLKHVNSKLHWCINPSYTCKSYISSRTLETLFSGHIKTGVKTILISGQDSKHKLYTNLKLLFFVIYPTHRVTGCSTSFRTLKALFTGLFQVEKHTVPC